MALNHYTLAITDVPLLIAEGVSGDSNVRVYLANGTGADCYVGDYTVTTADGYCIVKQNGQTIGYRQEFDLTSGDRLYAVCITGQTTNLSVLVSS